MQHYIRNCVTCHGTKAKRHEPYDLLQPHEVPTIMPYEHVSLGLIMDLLECGGFDAVVVFAWYGYIRFNRNPPYMGFPPAADLEDRCHHTLPLL
jgi:hypothetical protein